MSNNFEISWCVSLLILSIIVVDVVFVVVVKIVITVHDFCCAVATTTKITIINNFICLSLAKKSKLRFKHEINYMLPL